MKPVLLALIISLVLLSFPTGAETLSTGGPYTIGEMLSIQGETNFNTDNNVLVEVYPSSFGPTSKYDPSMTGGGSMVVPVVTRGSGLFSWIANISSAGWKPDQYMVRVEVIGKNYRETALVTLTENQSTQQTQLQPYGGASNTSASETMSTPKPTLTQKIASMDTQEQALAPVDSAIPVPTQTRQSPISIGFIICSLGAIGFIAGKRRG
ncbi:MAG: hypothetical protein V1862_10370 [Methanobacteriota archaeon]